MPNKRHTTPEQKRILGTLHSRDQIDLQGNPLEHPATPPEHFTERQMEMWTRFYDVLSANNILTSLDVFGLDALVLAYEKVVHNTDYTLSDIRSLTSLLGQFGLVPANRANIATVAKKQDSTLATLRKRRAA